MTMTKQEALDKIEELKQYVDEVDNKKEEKVVGLAIKNRFTGEIIFQSTKTTYKEAIKEKGNADLYCANLCNADLCDADLRGADLCNADLRGADLRGADLCGADLCNADLCDADLCDANLCNADLRGAELQSVKFYGKGGTKKLTKAQLPDFLNALGFQVED